MKLLAAVAVTLPLALAGCDSERADQAPETKPSTLTAEQRAVYERTCGTCHGRPGTGAPPAGDTEAWAPRVEQGLPALLDHTVNGYGGMPPMGLCMECDQEQLIAFIEYMAGVECDEEATSPVERAPVGDAAEGPGASPTGAPPAI